MVEYNDAPALFEEEITNAPRELDAGRGLRCDLGDAFARALGRSERRVVTLHARGVGMRALRLASLQGDVLRASCPASGKTFLIPLCSVYAFYEGELIPGKDEESLALRLDGGSSRRGCDGLAHELKKLIGRHAKLVLPETDADILIARVMGLALRAVSGGTIVTVRIDCVDALELPHETPEDACSGG